MRKIILLSFISLDGVMQAPGRPDEDRSDGFGFGGWVAPYFNEADKAAGAFMQKQLQPAELLLGRKTFEIFASYWPTHGEIWPGVNAVRKYVMSSTLNDADPTVKAWNNSMVLKDISELKKLKEAEGTDLQVHGSGHLAQSLFQHDLVDELWLKIFPVTLGMGKKLFAAGTIPAAFTLTDSLITGNGVIFCNYKRAGEVKTGTIGG